MYLVRGISAVLRSRTAYAVVSELRFYSVAPAVKGNFNIGTIGHVDHGKTTLTAAITKVLSKKGKTKFVKFDDIDKAAEEKKRGITINIAHIGYETNSRRYAHTDCPGHRDFIKNMICGTAQMDAAVLVIAATDGVMAQTREHILLAKQIGLKHIVVFINKSDLVEPDDLMLVELEARELLTEHGFDGDSAHVVTGSALLALEGIDTKSVEELLNVLDTLPEPERSENADLLLPIASAVQITGRGTVVVGTIVQGTLKKGDQVQLKGFDNDVTSVVTDIQVFKKSVPQVTAGEHCGVLCRGVKASQTRRGMWLGKPGTIQATNVVKCNIYLLSASEGGKKTAIRPGYTERVFCSTWDVSAKIHFKHDMLMPGEHTEAELFFVNDVPIKKNMSFTIREGRTKTVARGVVTDCCEPMVIDSAFRNFNMEEASKKIKAV
ncbi:unnamed protein product [Bursaphelenchus okinawaensis]|uniref:protein-synthesizing GTPase n=1 Tax=Bursaphelenchus okinawaensis TaxID=465554 RepID=A0A811JSU5_9BILA|nr:unnamed protein product [Bursaphelenchus okinawaensis]CAG9082104.1 unnamed protein product [Bursaphelenchus okinawaensis]